MIHIKKVKEILTFIIGLALLLGVLYFLGFQKIISLLSKTNLFYFVLAALSFFVVEILAALKLKLISSLKFPKIFVSHLGGMFLSQITPGRAGYLYTSYSLAKKEDKSISGRLGIVSLIMGVMMISKVFLIVLSIVYFSFLFKIPNYFFLSFLMPLLIIVFIFSILYSEKSKTFLSKIPILKKGLKYLELMQKAVKKISFQKFLSMILLDLCGWFFWAVQFFFLINSLGYSLSLLSCLMLQPILSAILFIPISPNALGLGESANALIFTLLGFPASLGVAFLILFRINTLLVDSLGIPDLRTIKIPKKIFQ